MRTLLLFISLLAFDFSINGQEAISDFVALYEVGEYESVIEKTDNLIFDPGSYEIYKLIGDCHHKVEDFQKAIDNYNLAEDFSKENSSLYVHRGAAYMGIGNYDAALKDLNKAVKVDDSNAEAYYYRGLWNFDYHKLKAGIKDFDKAIQNKKDYYEAHFMRAAAYAELKKWSQALSDYDAVQKINPEIEEAVYYSGMIYIDLENYEAALMELDKVENDYQTSGEYYFFRAEAKYYLKDRQGACADYKKSAALGDSDSINVYQNYCLNNEEKGRFKKTRETKVDL